MSLYDELKKHLTDMAAAAPPGTDVSVTATHNDGVFSEVIQMVQSKGLTHLSNLFSEKGMGDVFSSWVGKGTNLPISADQIKAALGTEQIEALAKKAGIDSESGHDTSVTRAAEHCRQTDPARIA